MGEEVMVTFTEEQARLYEEMIETDPKIAALPIKSVAVHEVNDVRILCLGTLLNGEEAFAHYADGEIGVAEMVAVTELHQMREFTCSDGTCGRLL